MFPCFIDVYLTQYAFLVLFTDLAPRLIYNNCIEPYSVLSFLCIKGQLYFSAVNYIAILRSNIVQTIFFCFGT